MQYQLSERHFNYLKDYEIRKHQTYDYKREGIVNKMISPVVSNTNNKSTKIILQFVEAMAQFLVDYVGELKQFKNPYHHRY